MKTMKKALLLCIVVFGLFLITTARPVERQTAESIAAKFMGTKDLQIAATYHTKHGIAAFYVFNTTEGFVIVSADDCETPIIGYSHEGRFEPNHVPVQMEGYLRNFVARIQYGIENHVVADELTARQWELVKTTEQLNDRKNAKAMEPLLTERWHQGCLYNSLCPTFENTPCGHAEAGCVAVAMGQIMHYHGYPSKGWGTKSYSNSGMTLSANFGDTEYNWQHMPDTLTNASSDEEIAAVATLLFHCGVSVKMSYGANGSGADSKVVPDAMMRHFDYSRQIHREEQADYSNDEWMALLKGDLNQHRPVYYSGYGTAGHAWVCDGYDTNDMLHFNWGWGGPGNGYYALGNLNPMGYHFNEYNAAILGIVPQYDPCVVSVNIFPAEAGTVEGAGEHHLGEQCTLTAVPAENARFKYWQKNGSIVSSSAIYQFQIEDDINDLEAVFSFLDLNQITASHFPEANDPNSPFVNLSWDYADIEWNLLKQFEIGNHTGVTTDGEYIYTFKPNSLDTTLPRFGKYSMDGELIELFNIEDYNVDDLTFDGAYFYGSSNTSSHVFHLYRLDLENKSILDSIHTMQFNLCSYDPENDAFWTFLSYPQSSRPILIDRQGERIKNGPTIASSTYGSIRGIGCISSKDGETHLLLVNWYGGVYDYDVANNIIINHVSVGYEYGTIQHASVGTYEGKEALFVIAHNHYGNNPVSIYEIKNQLAQIIGYRIYRSDSEDNTIMIADCVEGSSFTDTTWTEASAGLYRFGISMVYANGTESETIWSNPIEKTDYEIGENHDDTPDPRVQKVFENGQIVIIKDGKRYNLLGQPISTFKNQ